jgi:hypothetical protein
VADHFQVTRLGQFFELHATKQTGAQHGGPFFPALAVGIKLGKLSEFFFCFWLGIGMATKKCDDLCISQ